MIGRIIDAISDNLKFLTLTGVAAFLWIDQGSGELPGVPELPEWSNLVVIALLLVGLAGYIVGGKIDDLLPEERGVFLVCMEAFDDSGGEVWELTEDQFADMNVVEGSLMPWPASPWEVYEVRRYNAETNTAVANWRESVAGSELARESDVSDTMDAIEELRTTFEKEAQRGKFIRRRLGSILRVLDRRRAEDQAAALEGHIAPSIGDETIGDVIEEQLPDELQPDHLQGDEARDLADEQDGADEMVPIEFDALDDPLNPQPADD
jgi:hypothetical protein